MKHLDFISQTFIRVKFLNIFKNENKPDTGGSKIIFFTCNDIDYKYVYESFFFTITEKK